MKESPAGSCMAVVMRACIVLLLFASCDREEEIPNKAPFCSITFPKQEAVIEKGTTVRISVQADDVDGEIASLQYLINDISISCGYGTSFYYIWNTASEDTGQYKIGVRVEDDEGEYTLDEIGIHLVSSVKEEAPVPDFMVSKTFAKPGEIIQFSDASGNQPIEWTWDFGDGTGSSEQHPSHAYEVLGTYDVQLTAANAYGSATLRRSEVVRVTETGAETGTLRDLDGNVYETVKIGDQWWMAENLRVTHYAGGTEIPVVENATEWFAKDLDDKAMCFYDNSEAMGETYGALYTWAAVVNGSRGSSTNPSHIQGVCPGGWHVPSDDEWKELEMHLGMSQSVVNSMGHRGTNQGSSLAGDAALWQAGELKEDGAFGSTGFNGVPAGGRNDFGAYLYLGSHSAMWSCTPYDDYSVWSRCLYNNYTEVRRYHMQKNYGFAVRCVMD